MVRTKKMGNICLLYKDKFDVEDQKVCYAGDEALHLEALIPIYKKVLVPIPACPSPKRLSEMMGYSIDDIIEWRKRGWIETVISMPYDRYVGLSYLDELIRSSPSAPIRLRDYFTMLVGSADEYNRIFEKGQSLFRGPITVPRNVRRWFGEKMGKEIYLSTSAGDYACLSIFGLISLTAFDEVKELTERDLRARSNIFYWLNKFLLHPFIFGLRKTTAYSSGLKSRALWLYETMKPTSEIFFAPCWLADVYKDLETTIPEKMDTDEINAVRKQSEDFVRAVKGMDEVVDRTVREKFKGGLLDESEEAAIRAKKQEFHERWNKDVKPAFEDISKVKKAWSIGLTGSIVAPLVILPAFQNVLDIPTVIRALAASTGIKKLVDPAAEFLSTFFECNPIHLGFYKVHRELKKVEQRRGGK